MCGIVGFVSLNKYPLEKSLACINHRGPDNLSAHYEKVDQYFVGLGHARLSIIDLSSQSNQPFESACGNYLLVFNGEIYNYLSLKEDLIYKGHVFQTKSDTEVLLKMYIEYGVSSFSMLEGMFAFSILDKRNSKVFLVRDQLGIKPLYVYKDDHSIIFASEVKALKAFKELNLKINSLQLTEFLLNGFIYEPGTGFENLNKIFPGSYIEISIQEDFTVKEYKYWSPRVAIEQINKNKFEDAIKASIKEHLTSDVPLGLFFSGGVDSSVIFSQIPDSVTPFTIRSSDEEYQGSGVTSDYHYAKKVSQILGKSFNEIDFNSTIEDSTAFLQSVEKTAILSEELIADYTFISSEILSREAKRNGFTVMLSGMGADEVFGGYPRYQLVKYSKILEPFKYLANSFLKKNRYFSKKIDRFNTFFKEKEFVMKYSSLVGYFNNQDIEKLYKFYRTTHIVEYKEKLNNLLLPFKASSDLKKAQVLDLYGYLSHNFLVADKSSMQASIEMRVPLATKKLVELALSVKDNDLLSIKHRKKPLRNLLLASLPKKIIDRRKAGFNPPLDKHIKQVGLERFKDLFNSPIFLEYFNSNEVETILQEHFENKKNHTYKIYQLLYLKYFLENNIN